VREARREPREERRYWRVTMASDCLCLSVFSGGGRGSADSVVVVYRDVVVLAIAAVQVSALLLQTFGWPSFNPFAPLHRLLYAVFRVQGPSSLSSASSEKPGAGAGLGSLLEQWRSVALPVAVAVLSAVAQYYLLRYYSSPAPPATS